MLVKLRSASALAVLCLAAIVAGGALSLSGETESADLIWGAATAAMLVPLTWSVVRTLLRGDVGVDAIALDLDGRRARARRVPRRCRDRAHARGRQRARGARRRAGAARADAARLAGAADRAPGPRRRRVEEVPVDDVVAGDLVLVRAGEVLPVDGVVESDEAVLDESALTGESLPVLCHRGGSYGAAPSARGRCDLRASRPAAESAYAAIVRLVERPRRSGRRSSAWPTATPRSSCR